MAVDPMLGEVLAEREYEATDERSGETRTVLLRIGKPRPEPRLGGAWMCPHQILGLGGDEVLEAAGIDAVQALHLAMVMAGARLTYPPRGMAITWLGGSDLGLPLSDPRTAEFDFGDGEEP